MRLTEVVGIECNEEERTSTGAETGAAVLFDRHVPSTRSRLKVPSHEVDPCRR